MELQNSTILITGGTSGIGLEFVRQLMTTATNIIITGRDLSRLEEIKKKLPKINIFQSDVSKPQDIGRLHDYVNANFPKLNVLINNAGIMRNLDVADTKMDLENITQEIDTNLSGTIRMVQQFLPLLRSQQTAAIVNLSSSLAFIPFPVSPVYSAAKAGVRAYTQVLRLQLRDTNLQVFDLAPPQTESHLSDDFTDLDQQSGGPIMKVEKMVSIAIAGIQAGQLEIKPGLSKVFKAMSRIAPEFTLRMFDRALRKGKEKKRKLALQRFNETN